MTRRRRVGIVVIIAALFLVPPIVRATSTLRSSSSPIRLNRGFETPPSKGDVMSSLEPAAEPMSTGLLAQPVVGLRLALRDEPRVLPHFDHIPDPQRGPPSLPLR